MPFAVLILILAGVFAAPAIAIAPEAVHAEQIEPSLPPPLMAATSTENTMSYCSCVKYARTLIPNLPRGDASDFKANGPPQVGGLVLLDYDGTGHVAVITGFTADGITVSEGNYHHCEKDTRIILLNDPHIIGFWHES